MLKEWELNPSQRKFWTSNKRFVLFSGGFGCGKSLMLVLKAMELALKYPGNFILMGRKTYVELRDSLWKEFISTCPPEFLDGEPHKAEMKVVFKNKSEIIFRHLDTIAESEIRSINLGAAFIDQAEDIPKEVFLGLVGRLRREGISEEDRRIYLSCNPALTWLYADFKQKPGEDYEVIEASTLENKKNLPAAYIDNLLKYPESWQRQFVYGVWDMSLMSDRIVFAREYIEKLIEGRRERIETREGWGIFRKFIPGHRYQCGVDASEGQPGGDDAAATLVDLDTLEEVASWSAKVPPDVSAEKVVEFLRWYLNDGKTRVMIIPEMNSVGFALVQKLRDEVDSQIRLFTRREYDKVSGKRLEKYGWRTTSASKPLLISHFQELLRLKNPLVYSSETIEQFKSFVYTDEAKQRGMGAEKGFHDDRVIACLLGFFEEGEVAEGSVSRPQSRAGNIEKFQGLTPSIEIKNGKAVAIGFSALKPLLRMTQKWTVQ